MSEASVDNSRRNWLITSCAMGGAGAAAVAVPFVSSFSPSERAKAAGASIEVDISAIPAGQKITVEWRGKPVWIMKRTPEQLASLAKTDPELADPKSERTAYPTPEYAKNQHRSIKPDVFVGIGICTHLGCSPGDSPPAPSHRCPTTGKVASCVRATAPRLTWRVACSKTNPLPITWKCLRTCICRTPCC
jgi:ubiquinol-cytochrome c reductase iron-sulfur subunit